MSNYKEYRIAVDNNVVGVEQVNTATKEPKVTKEADSQPKAKDKDSISKLVAIQMGKKAAQYAIQNYGNWTGDAIGQAQINDALGITGMIAIASTGPLGLAAVGTNIALTGINRLVDINKSKTTSKLMETRLGITNRGSR